MVGNFCVVDNAAVDIQSCQKQLVNSGFIPKSQFPNKPIELGCHILGDVVAVGTRIGEQLFFV